MNLIVYWSVKFIVEKLGCSTNSLAWHNEHQFNPNNATVNINHTSEQESKMARSYFIDPSLIQLFEDYHNRVNVDVHVDDQVEIIAYIFGERCGDVYYSQGIIFPNQKGTSASVDDLGK